MILETKSLLLREMIPDDFQALLRVLGDPETMCHYSYTFDGQHVRKTHVSVITREEWLN
jgi:RimJ/RimL family protein N-acetyltransferase